MNDLTVIIPIHEWNNGDIQMDLLNAINSIIINTDNAQSINVKTIIVCPETLKEQIEKWLSTVKIRFYNYTVIGNPGETDYCSQINYAVNFVDTDWFSILEFDDIYTPNWFKSVNEYYYSREDVSVFLPINVQYEDGVSNIGQYCNELVWANEFSHEIGYIDFDCLEHFVGFNLTGGVFNTNDFKTIGGLKPSINIAFNYEFLLRLTNKKLKVFVIPKEGYIHVLNRKNSLTDIYNNTMTENEIEKWFSLAKCEYLYNEDRKTKPNFKEENLK